MPATIYSVAFSSDNQSAFISDFLGNIKIIKWQADANSESEFDFTEEPKKVCQRNCYSICLTNDKKYLLVGSSNLVQVLKAETREVIKKISLKNWITRISLIQDGKTAIIAMENGDLSILDLETMEISSIAEKITKKNKMYSFAII